MVSFPKFTTAGSICSIATALAILGTNCHSAGEPDDLSNFEQPLKRAYTSKAIGDVTYAGVFYGSILGIGGILYLGSRKDLFEKKTTPPFFHP